MRSLRTLPLALSLLLLVWSGCVTSPPPAEPLPEVASEAAWQGETLEEARAQVDEAESLDEEGGQACEACMDGCAEVRQEEAQVSECQQQCHQGPHQEIIEEVDLIRREALSRYLLVLEDEALGALMRRQVQLELVLLLEELEEGDELIVQAEDFLAHDDSQDEPGARVRLALAETRFASAVTEEDLRALIPLLEEAQAIYAQQVQAEPDSEELDELLRYTRYRLAWVRFNLGQRELALAALLELLAQLPEPAQPKWQPTLRTDIALLLTSAADGEALRALIFEASSPASSAWRALQSTHAEDVSAIVASSCARWERPEDLSLREALSCPASSPAP